MKKGITLTEVEEYMSPYNRFFSRSEARALASRYVWGLLLEGERKSVEPMALRVDASERSLQRLLTEVKWDYEGVCREYRRRLVSNYAGAEGVLVVGQTVFPKRGGHSVCVARQYSEEFGRMVSSQMATDSIYVRAETVVPWAMDLYVPKFWDQPRNKEVRLRRQQARIPGHIRHRQRWIQGLGQVELALDQVLTAGVVTAGPAFGSVSEFRDGLDQQGAHYVLELSGDTDVFLSEPVLVEESPRKRGRGRPRKRHRLFDAESPPVHVSRIHSSLGSSLAPETAPGESPTSMALQVWPAQGYRDGILRKPAWLGVQQGEASAGQDDCRYFLGNLPGGVSPRDLERITRAHEQAQLCKTRLAKHLGLLHHEGRSWIGWHRHVLLVFLAWGFLLESGISID